MTNAEKYKEVFGMEVDPTSCPTENCNNCPCRETDPNGRTISCSPGTMYDWWHKEYNDNYRAKWGILA